MIITPLGFIHAIYTHPDGKKEHVYIENINFLTNTALVHGDTSTMILPIKDLDINTCYFKQTNTDFDSINKTSKMYLDKLE